MRAVSTTYVMSGSRCGVSGVGTQIRIASGSPRRAKSVGGREEAGARGGGDARGVEVLDVPLAAADGGHLLGVDVEAEDLEPALGEGEREREADVAEADDADERLAPSDALGQPFSR